MNKKNIIIVAVCFIIIVTIGYYVIYDINWENRNSVSKEIILSDHKNAEFIIEGEQVKLGDAVRYFGNDLIINLNDDGRDDVVFLITHEPGGSGIFYYAVAALNTEDGYVGSDGYFLGDRIAPQTIEVSQNPRHVNVVVVNYVDRAPGEPMTAQPSVGKSVYLKLDPTAMQWGIVEPNFEGESNI